ncbi:MAG: LPS assembly lipoprotein LptE [Pseudomonadota bacterium]
MMARLALIAFVLVLAACGFRPLYGELEDDEGAPEQLGSFYIESITGPKDARQEVEDAMRRRVPGANGNETHAVSIGLRDTRRGVAVRISSDTQRFDYTLIASLRYRDLESDEVRSQTIRSIVSYGVVDSQYASLVGREDAVRRAAEDLARKIEVDMALFLRDRAPDNSGDALIDNNPNENPLFRLEQEALRELQQ